MSQVAKSVFDDDDNELSPLIEIEPQPTSRQAAETVPAPKPIRRARKPRTVKPQPAPVLVANPAHAPAHVRKNLEKQYKPFISVVINRHSHSNGVIQQRRETPYYNEVIEDSNAVVAVARILAERDNAANRRSVTHTMFGVVATIIAISFVLPYL